MLDFNIEFPLWVYLLLLAIILGFLAVSGVGIYYLVSKKFHKVTLIISALIILALIIPKSFNPYHWAEFLEMYSNLAVLFALSLIYLAFFAVINFIHRLFIKIAL
jgi:hypothetical protein